MTCPAPRLSSINQVETAAVRRVWGYVMIGFFKKVFNFDRLVGFGMLAAMLTVYVNNPAPVQFFRSKAFDFYQVMKPREIPPANEQPVTIIDLDERSLAEVGQWPWPRVKIAELVVGLLNSGAQVVAFDIVFPEADNMNPEFISKTLSGLDEETKAAIRKLPSNDLILANVLKQGRTVLGQATYWDERPNSDTPPVSKSVAIKGTEPGAAKLQNYLPSFVSMVRNIEVLEGAAKGHGIFSLVPETDGIVRRVPTLFTYEDQMYPALGVEMMRVMFGRKTLLAEVSRLGMERLKITSRKHVPPDGLTIPTDNKGRVWPYYSKWDKGKYVSAVDVMNGTHDVSKIMGRMAIIGTSAVGMMDIRSTPVDGIIPGVEVHAQLIENAMSIEVVNNALKITSKNEFLKRPPMMVGAELMLVAFGGLLVIWLVPFLGAKLTLLVFVVLSSSFLGGSWYLFTEERVLMDATFATLSTFLLYSTLTYLNFSREEAAKKQTRNAFSKYLSPDMVKVVAENPDQLKLGGEKRDMTLLFCDVRGFTTISEQFDAEGLTRLINKLLTPLTNVILARKGTVDKYMGDCIMAFWNAPLDDADHAKHGCLSALAMFDEMQPLNDRLEIEAKEEGRKHIPIKVGIGLNSGECVVGNMGSDQRFDYSVLGDTVNLASRLEGQSKTYGVRIVIGEPTQVQVPTLATIELDLIKVKGKTQAVRIFSLLGDESMAQDPYFQAFKVKIDELLTAFRAQKWSEAKALIAEAREMAKPYDIDGLFDLYIDRIAAYEATPPGEDWDGVFVATSK